MTHYFKPASLNAQISNTEQQLIKHQHAADNHAAVLLEKIQQQTITPASLLLAASIGFIAGELTQPRCNTANMPTTVVGTTPLKTASNLIASARTLYAALPLLLMIQSRFQSVVTKTNDANRT